MENSQYLGYFVQYNALFIVIVVFENIYLSMEKITGGGATKKPDIAVELLRNPYED